MRLIVARFDHRRTAQAARRRLLERWPSAFVEICRGGDGVELQATVDDAIEGPTLYLLYRQGATLQADVPAWRPGPHLTVG